MSAQVIVNNKAPASHTEKMPRSNKACKA